MQRSETVQHDQETVVAEKHDLQNTQTATTDADTVPNNQASNVSKKPSAKADDASLVEDLDPAAQRLAQSTAPLSIEDFYSLLGTRAPSSPADSLGQLAYPHGLYSQIYKEMRYNNQKFKAFDLATYILLLVQVLISAIFIILGSLRNVDTHITIAVLGAVATVISGGLALMKGQGLPNRLRQTRDSLRDVMFEMDELYFDFRSGQPVLYKDVKKIREAYLKCLDQARQNHPDVWNDAVNAIAQGGTTAAAKRSRNL